MTYNDRIDIWVVRVSYHNLSPIQILTIIQISIHPHDLYNVLSQNLKKRLMDGCVMHIRLIRCLTIRFRLGKDVMQ